MPFGGGLPASWQAQLGSELVQPYLADLEEFLQNERRSGEVYPPEVDVFSAFNATPPHRVRVVVLGQDPYHGPGQAHGLAFSVRRDVRLPPSLRNIFKELHADLGLPPARHGNLTAWAEQGVLLLNATLTVRAHCPNSHHDNGWKRFTDRVVDTLAAGPEPLAFVLWGAFAQKKAASLDDTRHLVLRSPHPSPLSASKGFFGSRPFSRINTWLHQRKEPPIDWRLPD